MIRQWNENCKENHTACNNKPSPKTWLSPIVDERRLPTRLIDVRKGQDLHKIHIISTANLPASADIPRSCLALSHRWGTAQDSDSKEPKKLKEPDPKYPKLTQQTRQDFQVGVPIKELPKHFQDAIFATRKLGFKYIWIDSLCIIQDEATLEDFSKEAPLMNQVYRNAALTLAAAASKSSSGGLFRDREPSIVHPYKMEPKRSMFGARIDASESAGLISHAMPQWHWDEGVKNAPLNQRAWVLQERVLSPRTIYFSEGQLFWECSKLRACEAFPHGMPEELVEAGPMVKAWDKATSKSSLIKDRGKYGLWRQILSRYSACEKPTNPSGKLIAIAGLAKEFARVFDDEVNYTKPHGIHPEKYRAPSWSWASLEMDVSFLQDDELDGRNYVEVLDFNVRPAGDGNDTTGAIQSASIYLRRHLVEIKRPTIITPGLNDIKFDAEIDKHWTEDKQYFLPLRRWRWVWKPDVKAKSLAGLVLRAKLDNDRIVYERVGVLNLDGGYPLSYLGRPPKTNPGECVKPVAYEPEPTLEELLRQVGRQTIAKHV